MNPLNRRQQGAECLRNGRLRWVRACLGEALTHPQVQLVPQLQHLGGGQAVELFVLIVEVPLEGRIVNLQKGCTVYSINLQ